MFILLPLILVIIYVSWREREREGMNHAVEYCIQCFFTLQLLSFKNQFINYFPSQSKFPLPPSSPSPFPKLSLYLFLLCSLQKRTNLSWMSTKQGITSCSETKHFFPIKSEWGNPVGKKVQKAGTRVRDRPWSHC